VLLRKLAGTTQGMSPITSLRDRRLVPNKFRYVQDLILPEQGGTRLSKTINTSEGPMIVAIDHHQSMGLDRGLMEGVHEDLKEIFRRDPHALVTANQPLLSEIQAKGKGVSGLGSLSFGWDTEAMGIPSSLHLHAPKEGLGVGANRAILNQVQQVYKDDLIPQLVKMNPGQTILLSNEPTDLARASLYQRSGLMGPLDPVGTQYSMVQPTGQIQPIQLFGGHLPTRHTEPRIHDLLTKAKLYSQVPGTESKVKSLYSKAAALGWTPSP